MTSSASGHFTCNVCGAACPRPPQPPGREVTGCVCRSTVRLRGLAALLTREIFGAPLALPDLPVIKGLRGFGMSDPPSLASQLEAKFEYTNTFYHQQPMIDIVNPPETEWGRYDFIVSSEVMEHVPPPIERAFANLCRLLKPDGVLVLTVPYGVGVPPQEHFPDLHEYALASPGGRTVLINRRRDGSVELFEDLCFHGGDGATLEMRLFNEDKLKKVLAAAGFTDVRIAAEDVPEFGVEHADAWSLPIVARKGQLRTPVSEIAVAHAAAARRIRDLTQQLATLQGDYERFVAFHNQSHQEIERLLSERTAWATQTESLAAERTQWALGLDKAYKELQSRVKAVERGAPTQGPIESGPWGRLRRRFQIWR